jgi:hypothetical protein
MADDGLRERLWDSHATAGSVWGLFASFPVLVLGLYWRDRRLLAATLGFVALNPVLFEPAADDSAWATRVVLGEREWLDQGLRSSPADAAFVALCAPVILSTLRAAVDRRPLRASVGTLASMGLMLLFFGRMARLYERAEQRAA